MPLQWRNQFLQSLEEGAGKQCSECVTNYDFCFKKTTNYQEKNFTQFTHEENTNDGELNPVGSNALHL